MEPKIYKSQIIEINCPASAVTVNFPDQPNLRNAKIQRISVLTVDSISVTPISYGTPMSIADMKKCFVTMQEGGSQVIQNKALLSFNDTAGPTNPYTNNPPFIQDKVFSWDKCFLKFGSAPTASIVALEVWYNDSNAN